MIWGIVKCSLLIFVVGNLVFFSVFVLWVFLLRMILEIVFYKSIEMFFVEI